MALSADQLSDFRGDLGLPVDPGVFTDAELQRFYTRAASFYGAEVLAIDQLLADASKRNDYATGQTRESSKQVFEMLMKLREKIEEKRDLEEGQDVAQLASLRPVPTTTNAPQPFGVDKFGVWSKRR